MSAIVVLKFDTATGAEETLGKVKALAKEHLLNLEDAAVVTWPVGKTKPKTSRRLMSHALLDDTQITLPDTTFDPRVVVPRCSRKRLNILVQS